MATIAYMLLERWLIACNGRESRLATAIGHDPKSKLSLAMYVAAVPLAFFHSWIAIALYVAVATMWFVPDRRIEAVVRREIR
jgi:hypothetical protein